MENRTRGIAPQPITVEDIERLKNMLDEQVIAQPKVYVASVLPFGTVMVSEDIYERMKQHGWVK